MDKRIALYARVSTAEQNVDSQLDRLRSYAQAQSSASIEYTDHGVSGTARARGGLDAMLSAARNGEISAVVIVKLDRIARSLQHLLEVVAELESLHVALVVLDQHIDTSTAAGRLLLHVIGSVAEFERGLISERTSSALAARKARGVRLGRPRRAVDVEAAKQLLSSGRSQVAVARELGVPRSVLRRAI